MKNKLKLLPLVAAFLFAPAYAEEKNGGYGGISLGQVSFGDICDDASSDANCEDKGFGFRGFGGISFNKYLALEVGTTFANEVASFTISNVKSELDYGAVDASVLGRYPFNDIFAVSLVLV